MTTSDRIVRPVLVAAIAVADDVLVLREAWQRAVELGHTLVVCTVVNEDHARPAAEAWLREMVASLGESAVQVAIDVRVGDRTDALLACASDHHAALLVLGATSQREGLLARLFGGRVAPLVAHFSERGQLTPADIAELKRLVSELDDGKEADDGR